MAGHMRVRRDPLRDPTVTAAYVDKIGTATARVFPAVVDRPEVDHLKLAILLAAAQWTDLMRVANRTDPIFPADVADMVGCRAVRASAVMNELKRLGLLAGSAAAGYSLSGPLARD